MGANFLSRLADWSAVRITYMAVVLLLLVSGVIWGTAHQADRRMRDELLVQARMVTQTIDLRTLKTLSGADEDIDKPAYKQVRGRFDDFKEANPRFRFLYIMGRRADGRVFFYLDSENVDSELYSAPGEEYEEISEEDARVFETKRALVSGPSSDRWGTWVSALVPIINPPTGEVAGVLGIDIDAHTWRWDIAARMALPAGLLLVLVTFFTAGLFAVRSPRKYGEIKPIQQRLLVPFSAVLLLLTSGAGFLLLTQQRHSLDLFFKTTRAQIESALEASIKRQVGVMNALGDVLIAEPRLGEAIKNRDREHLLTAYASVFNTMLSGRALTSLSFIDADRICMARLHMPDTYGDRVGGDVMDEAERTGAPSSGLEVDGQSSLTLKTVSPIYDGLTRIGFVETGIQFEKVVDALDTDDGTKFAVSVRKAFLDRTKWEERLRQLGRPTVWNRFSSFALVYATLPSFPADIGQALESWRPVTPRDVLETSSGDLEWGTFVIPLTGRQKTEIGSLIALINITEAKAVHTRLGTVGLSSGLVLLTGLLGFFYVLLRRTNNSIRMHQLILQKSEQRLCATLRSIGDGVITTDAAGRITDLNAVAEQLTGWTTAEAAGRSADEVFRIVDALTREKENNPVERAIIEEKIVELANHTILIAKDGTECQIADSCAPIRDANQHVIGAVLVFRDVGEDYRRRAALRASEERYRAIFEKNASIQYLVDTCDGRFIDVNPAACAFYGYSRERMKEMNIAEINTMWQSIRADVLEKARDENGSHFEFQHHLADGQSRDVESYVCTLNLNGRECLYGIVYDITARKRAEAELDKERDLVRALMENVPEHIYFKDIKSRFVLINRPQAGVFGLSDPVLAIGKTDFDFFTEEHARSAFETEQAIIRSGRPIMNVEEKETWPDGSVTWVLTSKMPLHDKDGNIIGTCGISHDITARKRIEQELSEIDSRLKAITDAAQDAIVMMDNEGRISFWNPAAERLFGYLKEEALGHDLHQLITPPKFRAAFQAGFAVFQKTGRGVAINKTLELPACNKSGKEITVEISLSAIQIEGQWHAVGLVRDITERLRAKEELLETNRRLIEATARANAMALQARQASTAKSDFLANMSHEIRTPMNGVIGMTGLLLDTELTDEQRRYAETVRLSAESLLGLINDILDFSKIEAGKMPLEILDFDLQELVEDLASTMALPAQNKGLELLYSVASEVPTRLRGDPGRLRQILANLVSNAIKFTREGEVAIRVTLETESMDIVTLRFSIRDTGIGIANDKISVLFEKFTQADNSTTRKYGGTGLGLAICKQLTELMGGEISLVSDEGKGSEFSFTVRLGKQAESLRPETTVAVDLHGVKVLIVDDNATSREILMSYLRSWNMIPSETMDGPTAIQILLQAAQTGDPFKLAVLDMQMPIMDGEMLGKAIKADARLASIHLVMLTSLGMRENAGHFLEIGFDACLTKPTRHRELKRALARALSGKKGQKRPSFVESIDAVKLQGLFSDSKARILLAEDNITNQQVALGILKKLGLKADSVANGEEAIKALETVPYDLVLMDVQMPVLDGWEATRRIRSPQSAVLNHEIHVIAMTAHAMQGDHDKCLAAGMDDYISKPVTPLTLARVLTKWLKADAKENKATLSGQKKMAPRAESSASEIPVWDFNGMMERMMEDKDLALSVLAGFSEDVGQRIQELKSLLDAGNSVSAERLAHSINGASGIIGGEALREVAFEIERLSKAGDFSAAAARLPELIRRFGQLKDALDIQMTAWRS